MTLYSNSLKIYIIRNVDYYNFLKLLLYSIKNTYFELDFSNYLYRLGKILRKEYQKFLFDFNYHQLEYNSLKLVYKNYFPDFDGIFEIYKKNYIKAPKNVIIGRIGELLAYSFFFKKKRKEFCIFKKMKSKIFESGIDLIIISFNNYFSKFEYYFYEIKTTDADPKNCIYEINGWFQKDTFSLKYIDEYESIKEKIRDFSKFSIEDKQCIISDLDNLAITLSKELIPNRNFYFCSCIFCNEYKESNSYRIQKNNLFSRGFDYIFVIEDLYKNIKEAYKCLNIMILT